jgi:maltose alpha-D-glucosyltransferase/alpha-amylase
VQEQDPNSTLNLVKRLIALRKSTPALGSRVATRVLHEGYPFAYLRGETHLVVVNPQRDPTTLSTGELSGAAPLLASGISVVGDTLTAEGFAYGIFALPGHA